MRWLAGFALALGLSGCVSLPHATTLSDAQRADLARASAYLDGLRQFSARFVQAGYFGAGRGEVWVSRPGRLRLRYDEGIGKDMVANHGVLAARDLTNGTVTTTRLDRTPLNLLLAARIDLSAGVGIASVIDTDTSLSIRIYDAGNPQQGVLTLGFRRHPLTLNFLEAQDVRGHVFSLQLTHIVPRASAPPGTFALPAD